jgi:hypothetical protein
MHTSWRLAARPFLSSVLAALMLLALAPARSSAQTHVVSPAELHFQLRGAAEQRRANLARLDRFLATDTARQALQSAKLDPARVRQAVSLLSDEELARLAAQTDASNFAGGGISLTNQQVTIIIIGAILIILVAVLVSR